jgi:hypothetical protein
MTLLIRELIECDKNFYGKKKKRHGETIAWSNGNVFFILRHREDFTFWISELSTEHFLCNGDD